jgi:hypothetical protein
MSVLDGCTQHLFKDQFFSAFFSTLPPFPPEKESRRGAAATGVRSIESFKKGDSLVMKGC